MGAGEAYAYLRSHGHGKPVHFVDGKASVPIPTWFLEDWVCLDKFLELSESLNLGYGEDTA